MESRVRLLKHPLHPMLVMFPVALFPLLLLLDALQYFYPDAPFHVASFWIVVAGLATTLAAIVPGIVDLAAIPDETKAHRTAFIHLVVGFAILAFYAIGLWARWPVGAAPANFLVAAGVDLVGTLLVTAQGWLGGELVYHHHIGVKAREEGADPTPLETKTASARGRVRERGASRP